MAGKPISMSDFKQAILLKKQGVSNRRIAEQLGINKETVNNKFAFIKSRGLSLDGLLKLDDPELEKVFHGGHSALTDARHEQFLSQLDYFREQLKDPHVTRYLLWEEYIKANPDGYRKSQFFHHLSQNLEVAKVTTVMSDLYVPGQMLMIDYAGDTLPVVDAATGEVADVQVFVATMPFSDYAFAYAVPSQKVEDFIYALRMSLEHLGGVPQIVKLDNLKAGVIKYHRHEPELNKALQDMGNHYHFVAQPCRPRKPTDKALVESCVRRIYNRVYAKLRKMTFFSIKELNEALAKAVLEHKPDTYAETSILPPGMLRSLGKGRAAATSGQSVRTDLHGSGEGPDELPCVAVGGQPLLLRKPHPCRQESHTALQQKHREDLCGQYPCRHPPPFVRPLQSLCDGREPSGLQLRMDT